MNVANSPEMNKLLNLIRFNCNFSDYCDNKLIDQSPDYLIEKYSHWISFDPVTRFPYYTPDSCSNFMTKYYKRWGSERSELVRRELLYLEQSKHLNLLTMVRLFETYFGPIHKISPNPKKGLHVNIENEFIPHVIEKNKNNLNVILRDLQIEQLIK